ncbi:23S rRNA (uracil(1939)-C(5))-methyltransferase RlmD [Gemella sp. zg-1178]|uniref:23S rRNA (uracil(1939)-C(5))-methyltransferase RlmD n=1 Tax=Gemella sp. zg-1178 TaxID=2840372 RepID=UPI001C0512AA|nr:23S rRNA (uracil(1939)-C(5))-methyltransferase RlmD [Gemella sp. zg-1178]MBU0278856.1 23S rRNA (uracil(1939)-C(5))-methyltransferase RlmD [Gemella sp. zg-1178]
MARKILLTIKKIGINGEGIGYYKKKITFVKGALPNEVVNCEIEEETPKYIRAKLLSIKEKSPDRLEAVRPEFLESGAYGLVHVNYAKQLDFKREIVIDAFNKYLNIKNPENIIKQVLPSPKQYHYRNKNQFPVAINKDGRVVAGLYKEATNELVDIKDCIVQHEDSNRIIEVCKKYIAKFKIPVSISKRFEGIKYISTRVSFYKGDMQVIFVANTENIAGLDKLVRELKRERIVKSIVLNIRNEKSHLLMGEENIVLYGQDHITEKIGDIEYKLSANSFFQLNPLQTKNLYDKVVEFADLKKNELVLDAFCGVGSIGQYVSKYCKEVYGIDIVEEAIKNAKENAELNNLKNCYYYLGHASKVLPKLKKEGHKFDVAIVDPPRAGLGNLAKYLLTTKAKRIVYVSCNPSTLAKDLKILLKKYKLEKVQPVDMFPQTASVEVVTLLTKRKT